MFPESADFAEQELARMSRSADEVLFDENVQYRQRGRRGERIGCVGKDVFESAAPVFKDPYVARFSTSIDDEGYPS